MQIFSYLTWGISYTFILYTRLLFSVCFRLENTPVKLLKICRRKCHSVCWILLQHLSQKWQKYERIENPESKRIFFLNSVLCWWSFCCCFLVKEFVIAVDVGILLDSGRVFNFILRKTRLIKFLFLKLNWQISPFSFDVQYFITCCILCISMLNLMTTCLLSCKLILWEINAEIFQYLLDLKDMKLAAN